jgi:hypothetical protein
MDAAIFRASTTLYVTINAGTAKLGCDGANDEAKDAHGCAASVPNGVRLSCGA